jgi:AmiR/NasT family two-component response regulator
MVETRAEAAGLQRLVDELRAERAHSATELARLTALAEQLETALQTRGVIERAKGILMVTRRCSADEAFTLLRRQSQHDNVKLRTVAEQVVAKLEHAVQAPKP